MSTTAPPASQPNVTVVDATFQTVASAFVFVHVLPGVLNVPAADMVITVVGVTVRVHFVGADAVAHAAELLAMPAALRAWLGITSLAPAESSPVPSATGVVPPPAPTSMFTTAPPASQPNVAVVDVTFQTAAAAAGFAHVLPGVLNVPAADMDVTVVGVTARVHFVGADAVVHAAHLLAMPAAVRAWLGITSLAPAESSPAPGGPPSGLKWSQWALYVGAPAGALLLIVVAVCAVRHRLPRRRGVGDVLDSIQYRGSGQSERSGAWELGSVSWADGTHTPSTPIRERHAQSTSSFYTF
jgi:hypothetical protein